MSSTDRQLWQQLRDHGLVTGDMPATLHQPPLYLRLFLGTMLWLAAYLLLFAVLGLLGALLLAFGGSEQVLNALGSILLLGLAGGLSRQRQNPFREQLVAAAAITGQILLVLWLAMHNLHGHGTLALAQLPVFFLVRNSLVRTLAVLLLVLIGCYDLGRAFGLDPGWQLPVVLLAGAWAYQAEITQVRWQQWLHPLKRGLTLALWFGVVLQYLKGASVHLDGIVSHQPVLLTLAGGGWLLWLMLQLHQPAQRLAGLALGGLVLLAGWLIPGVTVLGLLLALAWRNGQRHYWLAHLLGLVVVLMLYYYNLQQTLLVKAYILLGLAACLAGLRLLLLRLLWPTPTNEG